jgi:hypothetical protein
LYKKMKIRITKLAFCFAIGYSNAEEDAGMIDNGMRGEDERSKNAVYMDVTHALIDLFQILADASVNSMDVYELRLDIWSASLDNDLANPSKVDQGRVQKDINRISSDIAKTVTAKNKYLQDVEMLQSHVAEFFDSGDGNYDAILEHQNNTIAALTSSVAELEDASTNLEKLTAFSEIEDSLDDLEAVLMKLMDALANKIVSLQALMNEFGEAKTMAMPIPYVSSLYRLNTRINGKLLEK